MIYQLPLLLRSMRLVRSADLSAHLVVVVTTAPALSACRRLHKFCLIDDWATTSSPALIVREDLHHAWASMPFNKINWRRRELMNDIIRQVPLGKQPCMWCCNNGAL